MHGARILRVVAVVCIGMLFGLGAGCKALREAAKGKYKQENEHFKCKLELEKGARATKRAAHYVITCEAKKQPLELRDITVSYTFEEPVEGKSNSYRNVNAGEDKPLGDSQVVVTPDKPFERKGSFRPAVRPSKEARHRALNLTARVSYPNGRIPGLEGFDKTMKDMEQNPSLYKVELTHNL